MRHITEQATRFHGIVAVKPVLESIAPECTSSQEEEVRPREG